MLTTDAYAYLDVDANPLCAWATYRGILITPPAEAGFVSVWTAGLLGRSEPRSLALENALERWRLRLCPDRVSRLQGLFCFPDQESAKRALQWSGGRDHFEEPFLTQLNLSEATSVRSRMDANWITHAQARANGSLENEDWIARYWGGEAYPDAEPIWETIVQGRIIVLGTEIRERAYRTISEAFPESLCLLEIARLAAWIGSDLGAICAWMTNDGDQYKVQYLMNLKDANDPDFINSLRELKKSGYLVNNADITPFIESGSFGRLPDMRPYQYSRIYPSST